MSTFPTPPSNSSANWVTTPQAKPAAQNSTSGLSYSGNVGTGLGTGGGATRTSGIQGTSYTATPTTDTVEISRASLVALVNSLQATQEQNKSLQERIAKQPYYSPFQEFAHPVIPHGFAGQQTPATPVETKPQSFMDRLLNRKPLQQSSEEDNKAKRNKYLKYTALSIAATVGMTIAGTLLAPHKRFASLATGLSILANLNTFFVTGQLYSQAATADGSNRLLQLGRGLGLLALFGITGFKHTLKLGTSFGTHVSNSPFWLERIVESVTGNLAFVGASVGLSDIMNSINLVKGRDN